MKFRFFDIDETAKKIRERKSPAASSQLVLGLEQLQKIETKTILNIFLANSTEFWHLNYLYDLIRLLRAEASISPENENITISNVSQLFPVLTLYTRDSFTHNSAKRNFGIKYWDSSIWQRWVDIGTLIDRTPEDDKNYEHALKVVLAQLQWNLEFCWTDTRDDTACSNIYSMDIAAQEFCEFSTRLYKNAFIADLGLENTGKGHAGSITPFPFFEESVFYHNFLLSPLFIAPENNKLVWRVLLIDDKAERLTHLKNLFRSSAYGKKFDVLETETADHQKPALYFQQVSKFEDVDTALNQDNFDIVLLDYLLEKRQDDNDSLGKFGIDLFPNQNNSEEDSNAAFQIKKEPKGPGRKNWIFLTSCYSSAFVEGLREQGISFSDKNWIINRGADPINTPNTFLYTFTRFLEYQLNSYTGGNETVHSLWETWLDQIQAGNIREWASLTLASLLNYSSNIESLHKISGDKGNSLFARSFLKSDWYERNLAQDVRDGWFGYLTHLLYLLTSGDGNKWEEMKNDLEIVKKKAKYPLNEGYQTIQNRIEALKMQYGV